MNVLNANILFEEYNRNNTKIERKLFSSIIRLFFKKIIDEIIFNSYSFKLSRIGDISLYKRKNSVVFENGSVKKVMTIDRVLSKEYKKKIYHENEHTDGYIFIIKFSKVFRSVGMSYKFRPTNYKFKRYLSGILKSGKYKINAKII